MKTLDECKQEARKQLGYTDQFDWDDFSRFEFSEIMHLAAELYANQAREEARVVPLQSIWTKCHHKNKLPPGEYLLRLQFNNFVSNRQFTVSDKQKFREIPYFNVIAYFKIPDYNLNEEVK